MRGCTHVNITKPVKGLVLEVKYRWSYCRTGCFVLAVAGQVLSELAGCVAARKTAGTPCCTSLRPVRCGVLFSEIQWSSRLDLAHSHWSLYSADSRWSPVTATDSHFQKSKTACQPVCIGIKPLSGTRNQFFFHFHGNYFQIFAVFFLWDALPDKWAGL